MVFVPLTSCRPLCLWPSPPSCLPLAIIPRPSVRTPLPSLPLSACLGLILPLLSTLPPSAAHQRSDPCAPPSLPYAAGIAWAVWALREMAMLAVVSPWISPPSHMRRCPTRRTLGRRRGMRMTLPGEQCHHIICVEVPLLPSVEWRRIPTTFAPRVRVPCPTPHALILLTPPVLTSGQHHRGSSPPPPMSGMCGPVTSARAATCARCLGDLGQSGTGISLARR